MTQTLDLDEEVRRWLQRARDHVAELDIRDDLPVARQRTLHRILSDRLFAEFGAPVTDFDGVITTEHRVPVEGGAIVVREYRPPAHTGPLPGYVYLHGGGFWLGSIDEHINDAFCRHRAVAAGVVVFAVEYRLAPEHQLPIPSDDATAALIWCYRHASELGIDPGRIVLGGVSAGGNLALIAALQAPAAGVGRLSLLLEVPAVDLRDAGTWLPQYAEVNALTSAGDLRSRYGPTLDPADPRISPALDMRLARIRSAHILTAEYDPLRDGGELLAARLRGAGVPVTGRRHAHALHGSSGLTRRLPDARLWHDEVVSALRAMVAIVR